MCGCLVVVASAEMSLPDRPPKVPILASLHLQIHANVPPEHHQATSSDCYWLLIATLVVGKVFGNLHDGKSNKLAEITK